ncbi:MAG: copper homeostasis protein CutC, partial [Hyphomicrobiales bacterium]
MTSADTGPVIEICIDSIAGVRAAIAAGAQRVELCAGLLEGGITPSAGMIRAAVAAAAGAIKVHVIIRPRGGDFLFDADEVEAMAADLDTARGAGADGVVIGQLLADGRIDVATTKRLIERAGPL